METMIDGIWVCVFFVCSIAWVGGLRRVEVKKGGVLAFIGVHGGLLFLFLFTPDVFVFLYLYIATRIGAGGVWLCFCLLLCWPPLPCLYLGGSSSARIYLFGDSNILFSWVGSVFCISVHIEIDRRCLFNIIRIPSYSIANPHRAVGACLVAQVDPGPWQR